MTGLKHPDRAGYADFTFGRSNRSHQEDIDRARQAAEALFSTSQRRIAESTAHFPEESTGQTARRPRILSAVPVRPTRVEAIDPKTGNALSPKKRKKIPAASCARIRTWLKYGMTMSEVAEVCGVTIGEIERIL